MTWERQLHVSILITMDLCSRKGSRNSDHHFICTPGSTPAPPINIWWLLRRGQSWHAVRIYQVTNKKQAWTCVELPMGSWVIGRLPSSSRPGLLVRSLQGVRVVCGWAVEVGRLGNGGPMCYKIWHRESMSKIISPASVISVSSFSSEGSFYTLWWIQRCLASCPGLRSLTPPSTPSWWSSPALSDHPLIPSVIVLFILLVYASLMG